MKSLGQALGCTGKVIFLFFILAGAPEANAATKEEAFRSFFEEFQKGGYARAAEILQALPAPDRDDIKVLYWEGVALSKIQRFDLAVVPLQKVVAADPERAFKDAAYLLGQASYSTKDLIGARAAFLVSLEQKYNLPATLYYLGYVENQLGNEKRAIEIFRKILELPADNNEYRQPATFQIAEAEFELASKLPQGTKEEKIAKHGAFVNTVLPRYDAVLVLDPKSSLSQQAKTRINGIKVLYGLNETAVEETAAGIPKPKRPWALSFTQDIKYDTNITNQASGKLDEVSHTASMLSKTGVNAKWEFFLRKWFIVTPELLMDATYHSKRTDPVVYTNDAINTSPALRTRIDHKQWNKPAAALIEYEFNYNKQDRFKRHEMDFKVKSHNIIVGMRGEPLPYGSTTLKFSYKFSNNSTDANDYGAPKFSAAQNIGLGEYNLNTTLAFESQLARDPTNDQKSYSWNNSLSGPKLYWDMTVDYSLNFTITDTLNQAATRGTERTIAPGVTLNKELDKTWSANASFNYTNNDSKDKQNYDYNKSVFGIGIKATL